MKKFIALLLGIVMMFSMATFVGCGDDQNPSGGNGQEQVDPGQPEEPKTPEFEKVDAAKLDAVKAYLSANKGQLVGNREAADWMRGFEITLGLDLALKTEVKLDDSLMIMVGQLINGVLGAPLNLNNFAVDVTANASASEVISWKTEKNGTTNKEIVTSTGTVKALASGTVGANLMTNKNEGQENVAPDYQPMIAAEVVLENASADGSLYLDGLNAFYNGNYAMKLKIGTGFIADPNVAPEMQYGDPTEWKNELKGKFPAEIAVGSFTTSMQEIVDLITGSVTNIDESINGLIDINAQVGPFTIYVLESDKELNVKFTVEKESLVQLAAMPGIKEVVDLTPLLNALQLNACELTYEFDKTKNEFVGTEVKIDIAVKSADPIVLNIGGAQPGTVTLSNTDIAIKLNAGLNATEKTVTLPTDLNTYEEIGAQKEETAPQA